tara:strand:+ start:214 stop:2304 length:2091 start_codon:yes stop_codon:yes gene_type:complete
MIKDLNQILIEWSYRTSDGKPDVNNNAKLLILEKVLNDFGWSREARAELLGSLMEAPKKKGDKIDPETKVKYKIKDKDGKDVDKETTYKSAISREKDSPAYIAAKALQKGDDKEDGEKLDEPSEFDRDVDSNKGISKDFERPVGDDGEDAVDTKELKSGIPNQKDKSLKDVNTSKSEVYSNSDTGISDEEFSNKKITPPYENEEDEMKESELDEYFKSGKIPKKYKKVITRLMNSTNEKQSITDYMTGVGAGQIQSQAGEILTMASIGMDDKEFSGFMDTLNKQVQKYQKGKKPIVTKDWLESVKNVRTVTNKRYDSQYGEGNWSISNSAWDVPNEFEALGNDDYSKNKGFSSDMYVKLKVNGKPTLDEISLKKDSTANIYNGVVTDINSWSDNVPSSADIKEYKKGELQRPTEYASKTKTLKYNSKDLLNKNVIKNKNLKSTLGALGVISGDAKRGYKIEPNAQKILNKLSSMEIPPPIDRARFKEVMGTGDTTRFKKYMLMHAVTQRANEIANDNNDETESSKFLNNHLGYEKGEDGKFPEGSIKRYQNDTIGFLVEDEQAKEGCLNALAEKLPMKSLLEGEEKMAIGGLSADPKTLKRIFGIDNYDNFKAGLTMNEDDEGNNYLVYESKEPAKNVRIAEVKCRQKGLGYASSVGLEFAIAKDFGKELYDANKEEYPPEPEISDKERRKFGVGK